jgi:hypothetical protein
MTEGPGYGFERRFLRVLMPSGLTAPSGCLRQEYRMSGSGSLSPQSFFGSPARDGVRIRPFADLLRSVHRAGQFEGPTTAPESLMGPVSLDLMGVI